MTTRVNWLWLLLSPALWAEPARNPFQPPLLAPCSAPSLSPAGWQLKGIVGQPARRHGWVLTPNGQWLRLIAQQTVLADGWRVGAISARMLVLHAIANDPLCPPAADDLRLTLDNHKEEK
ncbi:HofP DNA utilization family protein [Serratia odorifera]|jgi:pilus assembly protein HofP|uniref:DUF2531 family protein n=2 Tax=Serratia odorifera TaxID=618 RepID=D4DYM7_SEROD|nr:HofP DNA utilization family protein [Serratia odorifera]EFE97333.1 hypothetical protein HMPREF0758_1027 [Serratia odorifera DSM 4582]MBJ2066667.1 DUF2531 family protein [Serratia odorifera]PNK91831.1 DUF2531 domain-containing protein [Serratia odorifera]RII73002.1 DUF2531 family protein [Serratia odorifera]VDZ54281.1 Protein of uncharacterised function (DUF2531) [Serratia odorifera]